jgi:hypothetical protein
MKNIYEIKYYGGDVNFSVASYKIVLAGTPAEALDKLRKALPTAQPFEIKTALTGVLV